MRRPVDAPRVHEFMRSLARGTRSPHRVYFTGGATAVLIGWRSSTIDLDIKIEPEADELLRAIPEIKETLAINVELASPDNFIPELDGWRERSLPIAIEGAVSFKHYDPYAQALSKIERGHRHDLEDVGELIGRGLVDPDRLLTFFQSIEPALYRFPAIDPKEFKNAVHRAVGRDTPG